MSQPYMYKGDNTNARDTVPTVFVTAFLDLRRGMVFEVVYYVDLRCAPRRHLAGDALRSLRRHVEDIGFMAYTSLQRWKIIFWPKASARKQSQKLYNDLSKNNVLQLTTFVSDAIDKTYHVPEVATSSYCPFNFCRFHLIAQFKSTTGSKMTYLIKILMIRCLL